MLKSVTIWYTCLMNVTDDITRKRTLIWLLRQLLKHKIFLTKLGRLQRRNGWKEKASVSRLYKLTTHLMMETKASCRTNRAFTSIKKIVEETKAHYEKLVSQWTLVQHLSWYLPAGFIDKENRDYLQYPKRWTLQIELHAKEWYPCKLKLLYEKKMDTRPDPAVHKSSLNM